MDQDLDLTNQQQPVQQPEQSSVQQPQPVQPRLSTDEVFSKLFEEKKLTWVDVMAEMIEWIDLKYPTESDDLNLLDKFESFNSFISSFYADRK